MASLTGASAATAYGSRLGGLDNAARLAGHALARCGAGRRHGRLARRRATLGTVTRRSARHASADDGRRLSRTPMGGKRVHERHRKADEGDAGSHLDGGSEA